jgi:hypothetical protein
VGIRATKRSGMAGTVKERIKDWMRRRFPPETKFIKVYECADVAELMEISEPTFGLGKREGMLFTSRDAPIPAPRKELVILTSALASYSTDRIIKLLDQDIAGDLESKPHTRLLVDDELGTHMWGESSIGGVAEEEPCETPQHFEHPAGRA